jgi:hypothetical protein
MTVAPACTKKARGVGKGPPGVVASTTLMTPVSPAVAAVPTTKLAVNVPSGLMVHCLLTTSTKSTSPPCGLSWQFRTVAALTNPPPVMLTVPQPGGALAGDITIAFAASGLGTFVYPDAPDDHEPPE